MWELLLAQAEEATASGWIATIGGYASLGFTGWYAWYVTTKTIPKRDEQHSATIEKIVEEFRQESKEQREIERQRLTASIDAWKEMTTAMNHLSRMIEEKV